ncbi:MAG: type II toxin-antitoxin system RelE/ParE family toxin, partial [Ruminococcaceae bacterium]|nr:type II toxin-antitoxin system RelE/ParE family toxin [Oscillospiraceae bacterium]
RYSSQAKKDAKKLPKDAAVLVRKGIEGLTEIPPKGDIKSLQGYNDGRKRLRIGKYRIIFQYKDDGVIYVWIIEIGSRGDIYK